MQSRLGIARRGGSISVASAILASVLMLLTAGRVQGQKLSRESEASQQKTIASLKAHPGRVNQYDSHGYTPLMRAAQYGDSLVARYLLQHGARVGLRDKADSLQTEHDTALKMAIIGEHYNIAEMLLQRGANIDGDLGGITLTSDMSLPVPLLSMAARGNDLNMIRFLAKHGANLDAVDEWGNVPLFYSDNITVAKALIALGAHVNPKTRGAHSLLDSALESMPSDIGPQFYVTDDIINLFLKAGATSPDAMCLAASRMSIDPLKQMLAQGWSPNRRNRAGLTPLMVAAADRRPDVVRLLLMHKARVDLRSPQGKTALMLARTVTGPRKYDNVHIPMPSEPPASEANRQEVIRLLLAAGAKE